MFDFTSGPLQINNLDGNWPVTLLEECTTPIVGCALGVRLALSIKNSLLIDTFSLRVLGFAIRARGLIAITVSAACWRRRCPWCRQIRLSLRRLSLIPMVVTLSAKSLRTQSSPIPSSRQNWSIYMRNAPGLNRAPKLAAEHGLAAAAYQLNIKAAEWASRWLPGKAIVAPPPEDLWLIALGLSRSAAICIAVCTSTPSRPRLEACRAGTADRDAGLVVRSTQ